MEATKISQTYADALTEKLTAQIQAEGSSYLSGYLVSVQPGQVFDKLVIRDVTTHHGMQSPRVHAFIERSSGKLIKAASWKAPQKSGNVPAYRFDLSTVDGLMDALSKADFAGGYLYAH